MSKTTQDEFMDLLGNKILCSVLEQFEGDRFYFRSYLTAHQI